MDRKRYREKSVLRVGSLRLNFRFIVSASHSINCGFKVSGRQYLVSLQRRNDCSKILTLCQMPPDKSGWFDQVEEKHHIFVENLQMWLTLGNSGNWIHQAPVYKLGKQGPPFFFKCFLSKSQYSYKWEGISRGITMVSVPVFSTGQCCIVWHFEISFSF